MANSSLERHRVEKAALLIDRLIEHPDDAAVGRIANELLRECGPRRSLFRTRMTCVPFIGLRALIPGLEKRLKRIAARPLDYPAAQTLRKRLMEKDYDKLLTFLRQKNVDPTNNHAERSIRPHVIMRKICGGTRSAAGSESHAVLPSLLQTAQRQGKSSLPFLLTLLTGTPDAARNALFANGP